MKENKHLTEVQKAEIAAREKAEREIAEGNIAARKAAGRAIPKKKTLKKCIVFFLLCLAIAIGIAFALYQQTKPNLPKDSTFTVTFLDVGQADCALITCDNQSMLIDAGNRDDGETIADFLDAQDVHTLQYVLLSHMHEDHTGGLETLLSSIKIQTVLCPALTVENESYQSFLTLLEKQVKNMSVPQAGDSFSLGSATVSVLTLNNGDSSLSPASDHYNDDSMIVKITYGNTSFLFTGDAEESAENAVINSSLDFSCTVLKVAHHGSSTSSSQDFLDRAHPKVSVISVGRNNEYGHPHDAAIRRLYNAESYVLRTDELGNITMKSDGRQVTITADAMTGSKSFREWRR